MNQIAKFMQNFLQKLKKLVDFINTSHNFELYQLRNIRK